MAADSSTPAWPFAVAGVAGLMLVLFGGLRLARR
jgi:hypothetical protein